MAAGLSSSLPAGVTRSRLRDVRAWWRDVHPRAPIGQRLYVVYCFAIYGLLGYGTVSSTAKVVLTPSALAAWGPALALVALLIGARWGAVQGPVVFAVADVAQLLGAPLPRRGLGAGRLVRALALGGAAGALVAACAIAGLAAQPHGIEVASAAGLVAGLALGGVLAVLGGWAVQVSARRERVLRRATWPLLACAAALAWAANASELGRDIALWSGPWGWAVAPGTGVSDARWLATLAILAAITVCAAVVAVRGCGHCPTERHFDRAQARSGAVASMASFDARTARRSLAAVSAASSGAAARSGAARTLAARLRRSLAPGSPAAAPPGGRDPLAARLRRSLAPGSAARPGSADGRARASKLRRSPTDRRRRGSGGLRWLRVALARPAGQLELAVVWRDAIVTLRARERLLQAVVLAGGGTALGLVDGRPLAVLAGALCSYVAAALLLEPLRAETDAPNRVYALLRARLGRVLLSHAVVPAAVVTAAGALAALATAVAGELAGDHGAACALAAVAGGPAIALCAALSARRGGRLPLSVLSFAVTGDPSGGMGVIVGWLLLWPTAAVILGAVPVIVAASGPSSALTVSLICCVAAPAVLAGTLLREPAEA